MYKYKVKSQGRNLKIKLLFDKIGNSLNGFFKVGGKNRNVFRMIAIIVLMIGLYIVLYPFFPRLKYLIERNRYDFPYQTNISEIAGAEDENVEKEIPEENRVVIPKIGVDMPIVEGTDDRVLDIGVWHRPATGKPGFGNMVLTGHRFGYDFLPEDVRNSTSFYNLDKLEKGDYIIIYWNGVEYDYQVEFSEVVDKMDKYIEDQTDEERLTLYTCHPIGQNDKRLVYYAKPIN